MEHIKSCGEGIRVEEEERRMRENSEEFRRVKWVVC